MDGIIQHTILRGNFPSIKHNEILNITASLFTEICHDVAIEPHLQQLTGKVLSHMSANHA